MMYFGILDAEKKSNAQNEIHHLFYLQITAPYFFSNYNFHYHPFLILVPPYRSHAPRIILNALPSSMPAVHSEIGA